MRWKIALTAAAAGLMSLSVAAPQVAAAKSPLEPDAKPKRQCFWSHQVNGFASRDDRIVNVRVGVKDVYQFEMFGRCNEVDWANKIALVSRGGSSICTGSTPLSPVSATSARAPATSGVRSRAGRAATARPRPGTSRRSRR